MCRGQQLADLWVWKLRDKAVSVHMCESSALQLHVVQLQAKLKFTSQIMPCYAYAVPPNIYEEPIFDVAIAAQLNAA